MKAILNIDDICTSSQNLLTCAGVSVVFVSIDLCETSRLVFPAIRVEIDVSDRCQHTEMIDNTSAICVDDVNKSRRVRVDSSHLVLTIEPRASRVQTYRKQSKILFTENIREKVVC